jgi:hypothetical protein
VFTARYALSPYIKQIRFVSKGLIQLTTRIKILNNPKIIHICTEQDGSSYSACDFYCEVPSSNLGYTSFGWIFSVPQRNTEIALNLPYIHLRRSEWPRGLRRRSAAQRLLGSRVRISPQGYGCLSLVQCLCCQVEVSATGPIPRPEESYRLWCVSECDQVKINNPNTYCE